MAKLQILLVFILLLILFSSTQISAQVIQEKPEIVERHSCEIGSLKVDILRSDAEKVKERIFVLFRAGIDETTKTNFRRLQIVKKALLEKVGWSSYIPEIVFAIGEPINGKGRVEFYIGVKLSLVFLLKKNRNICVYCCDVPGEK